MRLNELLQRLLRPPTIIGVVHIVSGWAILKVAGAMNVTPLWGLQKIFAPFTFLAPLNVLIGSALLIIGSAAVIAELLLEHPIYKVALLLPQQFAMISQLVSIVITIKAGIYFDGYAPAAGSMFILSDQSPALFLSLWHTLEVGATIAEARRTTNGR